MTPSTQLRLGTRGSDLALWQARWVAARLQDAGVAVELVRISTQGDRQQQGPIGNLGAQGVFTKEIQRALLDERIDLAVHSLKDLPTDPVAGLSLAAVPKRAATSDVLVCPKYPTLAAMPGGSVLGTGSLRRRSQLLNARPDLRTEDIRGNVETRIEKVQRGDYDAVVLAEAGLRRLGLEQHITEVLPIEIMLPAVGQGALGVESRSNDKTTQAALQCLDDEVTHAAVTAERAMLAALQGGCLAPIAAWGRIEKGRLELTGRVLSVDGTKRIEATAADQPEHAEQLGQAVADALCDQGAAELVRNARENT